MKKEFRQVWSQLRAKRREFPEFLEQVTIRNLRGIPELTVSFAYPVTVLAGPNCCGKSTVLAAMACAYNGDPGEIFPVYNPPAETFPMVDGGDAKSRIECQFRSKGQLIETLWVGASRRGRKNWGLGGFAREGEVIPSARPVFLRALSNIAAPPDMSRFADSKEVRLEEVDASLIRFAERILPFRYKRLAGVRKVSGAASDKPLLLAVQSASDESASGRGYSEFHMSSGERAILQLSMELTRLQNALVLLDEVELGLHPYTQEQLMLELQRLALRNNLQIVVTTHSPTILETVPKEDARLFMERDETGARIRPPYRDIVQNALYGRATDVLSVLCEDEVAENLIRGVFDFLNPLLNLRHSDIRIGRDTNHAEFKHHFKMLQMFRMTENFLFVLDGDPDALKAAKALRDKDGLPSGGLAEVLNLPGERGPEEWIWRILERDASKYAALFGTDKRVFAQTLAEKEQLYSAATGKPRNTAKHRLESFCEDIRRDVTVVARTIGRRETEREKGEMFEMAEKIREAVLQWRMGREI